MVPREALDRTAAYFRAHHPEVVAAYLFGSIARGDARPDSDVDIAVLLAGGPPRSLESWPFELADELDACLGMRVDLVVLNEAPSDLVHRVLRDGLLVVERDRSARVRFEVRARADYFDMEPIRRTYRRGPRPPRARAAPSR